MTYKSNNKYIGYWKLFDKDEPDYDGQPLTFPVENSATHDQTEIIARLKLAMETGHIVQYRGWSTCRLCGKRNGIGELEIIQGRIKYSIPEGYLHYLEDHNVGVDPTLLDLI